MRPRNRESARSLLRLKKPDAHGPRLTVLSGRYLGCEQYVFTCCAAGGRLSVTLRKESTELKPSLET